MARCVQCQINVAGLILVENETFMTTLRGLPFEAFGQFPKAVRYVQGSKLPPHLTPSCCPDRGGNRFGRLQAPSAGRRAPGSAEPHRPASQSSTAPPSDFALVTASSGTESSARGIIRLALRRLYADENKRLKK